MYCDDVIKAVKYSRKKVFEYWSIRLLGNGIFKAFFVGIEFAYPEEHMRPFLQNR